MYIIESEINGSNVFYDEMIRYDLCSYMYFYILGATCIAVRVDMSCFKIQVFDNGHGIKKEDLETVAER